MAPKRVLIVDDALDLGRLLQNTLVAFDQAMSVRVVPSAEEAILEIGKNPLDLLVSDIRLPGISGIDLIQRVRSRHPAVKVIAITALSDETIMDQARSAADVFLQKPLDIYEFVDHAQRLLGLPRTAQKPIAAPVETPTGVALPSTATLAEILAGLRGSLGAISAALLDESGRVVAQAGDLPGGFEQQMSLPIMVAMSSAFKVATALGVPPAEFAQVFRGKNYSLVCAPAHQCVLVVALKAGKNTLRLSIGVEGILETSRELAPVLEALGMVGGRRKTAPLQLPEFEADQESTTHPLAPPGTGGQELPSAPAPGFAEPDSGKVMDAEVKDIEALLEQPASPLNQQELDDFWNKAQSAQAPDHSPDVLSFDQARKLGLAPGGESSP
jgi:CheY-like chemotaxis protein